MDKNTIGLRITQSGMTNAAAAEELGVTPDAISKWKSGKRQPSDTTLLEWASGTVLQQGLARELLRQRYPSLAIYKRGKEYAAQSMATGNRGNGCTCLSGSTLCPACRGE